MQPVVQAVLRSWSVPPVATFALALIALTYLRGAWLLRRAGYPYLPAWRIGSLALGLFALWFALASPLDTFSSFVLTAHMLQHMLLMMVAPPLILLGEPLIPIVRGMPRFAAREFAGPFLNWPVAQRIGLALTSPVVALLLMGVVMFAWHVPGLYELALRSSAWHQVEHACFFFISIIFWWPVIQPWPSRAQSPRWTMVPYLLIGDLQNTVLSATLVFSDKILYPSYAAAPGLFGLTPQEDQAAAGAIMWVVGSLAFIVPAVLIAIQCLARKGSNRAAQSLRRDDTLFVEPMVAAASPRLERSKTFGKRMSSGSREAVSFVILFLIVATGFAVLSRLPGDDDDQVLRASQRAGPFTVSLYGRPGDVPIGPAGFAVLVQDRASHEVLLDSIVELSLRKANDTEGATRSVRALPGEENHLLFGAELDFDTAGAWVLNVTAQQGGRDASVSLPVEVVNKATRFAYQGSDVVILVLACVLCAVYVWRHTVHRSAVLTAPIA